MITDNLFETKQTHVISGLGTVERSGYFEAYVNTPGAGYLNFDSNVFPDAYWLGWIRPENVPTAFLICRQKSFLNNITPRCICKPSILEQNFNVAYTFLDPPYGDYWNNQAFTANRYSNTASNIPLLWKRSDDNHHYITRAMLNRFYIGIVNCSYITVTYVFVTDPQLDPGGVIYNINAEDFETWKNGKVNITYNGNNFEIDNEILNTNFYQQFTINGTLYRVFIGRYNFVYDTFIDQNGNTVAPASTWKVTPTIDLYGYGGKGETDNMILQEVLTSNMGSPYNSYANSSDYTSFAGGLNMDRINQYASAAYRQFATNRGNMADNVAFFSSINGYDYDFEDTGDDYTYRWTRATTYGERSHFFVGNTYFHFVTNYCDLIRMYQPADIIRHASLMPRWKAKSSDPPTYGVVDGVYYPEVLDSGEFTGRLITGTRAELLRILQQWQYDELSPNTNDYSAEDLPPYEPPEPSDDARSGGEDNLPNRAFVAGSTNGFVTLYVLTANQLEKLSEYLWASLFSVDFIASVGIQMFNDFSLYPSDILKYFTSLRMYPMDLSDLNDRILLDHDWIYFGRGIEPVVLNSGENMYTLGSYCETFDGGNCLVPAYYNDFRDYEPFSRVTITVPFCGSAELTPSEIVGFNLRLSYAVDFSTGIIEAVVWVQSEVPHIVATLSGSIGSTVQLSASNNMEFLQKLATAAVPIATSAFAGGIGLASGSLSTTSGAAGLLGAEEGVVAKAGSAAAEGASYSSDLLGQVQAPDVSSSPVHVAGMSSGFSNLQITRAFISIQRRHYEIPDNYYRVYGRACNYSTTLENVSGFTVCKNVEVNTLKCTVDEQIRIKQLLETGVFL